MFNATFDEIGFPEIEAFCRNWSEGVRVEYKREVVNISKIVASFANSQGGIWLIGVDTDKHTNFPIFPLCGCPITAGIEEKITQSCLTGVYPPIDPAIKVVRLPKDSDRCIIVVKISESVEAPHAIENTTRVYTRVHNTTNIIQLAEIDRIDYLLQRRREPEKRRENIIAAGVEKFKATVPQLAISIGPLYPHRPIFTPESLTKRVAKIQGTQELGALVRDARRSQEGYVSARPMVLSPRSNWLSLSFWGVLVNVTNLEISEAVSFSKKKVGFILLTHLVVQLARCIGAAQIFLDDTTTNLLLRIELKNVAGLGIHPGAQMFDLDLWLDNHVAASTDETLLGEISTPRESLTSDSASLMIQLIKQLMWGFDWAEDSVDKHVLEILKANRFA